MGTHKILLKQLKCLKTSGGDDDTYAKFFVDGHYVSRWPNSGDHDMGAGAEVYIAREFKFYNNMKVELWEYDSGSGDDFLGSHKFFAGSGSGYVKLENSSEGDRYQLFYEYIVPAKVKTVYLRSMKCVSVSSGIDAAVIDAVFGLTSDVADAAGKIVGAIPEPTAKVVGAALEAGAAVLSGVPLIIKAIDSIGDYPDQLYLTRGNKPGKNTRFWPSANYRDGYYEMHKKQTVRFNNVQFRLTEPVNINMWEYDYGSGDDDLGRISIDVNKRVGNYIETVASKEHKSIYLVAYSIVESLIE